MTEIKKITGPLLRSTPRESDCEIAWREQGLDPAERFRPEPLLLYFTEGRLNRMDFLEAALDGFEPQQCPRIGILTYGVPEVKMRVDKLMQTSEYVIYPIGWTEYLPAFFSVADAVYCKPGPGVTLQALYLGARILFDATQPWMRQESSMARLLCRRDYAHPITDARGLRKSMRRLMKPAGRVAPGPDSSDVSALLHNGLDATVTAILEELTLTA